MTQAITVAATDDIADTRPSWSNFGSCVDIFAPGVNILSTSNAGNLATETMSGTSMAAPHAAGVAALNLSGSWWSTPADVAWYLSSRSTKGVVNNPGANSPNAMLFTFGY